MRKSVLFTLMVAVLFAMSACGDGDEATETSATAPTPAAAPEPTAGPTAPAAQPTASAPRPTAAPTPPAAAQATSQPAPPTPPPTNTPALPKLTQPPAPQPTQPPTPEPTATAQPEIAVAPEGEPEDTPAPVGLFLEVTEPEDETILANATLDVQGMTTPDAIVTINGELAEVDADGNFSMAVKLAEGPNVLEIVGSDFSGVRIEEIITVLYVP